MKTILKRILNVSLVAIAVGNIYMALALRRERSEANVNPDAIVRAAYIRGHRDGMDVATVMAQLAVKGIKITTEMIKYAEDKDVEAFMGRFKK